MYGLRKNAAALLLRIGCWYSTGRCCFVFS